MRTIPLLIISVFAATSLMFAQDSTVVIKEFPELKGEYLGQTPPGKKPKIFAPGVISTKENIEGCSTFSKDGKEFYFTKTEGLTPTGKSYIMVSKVVNGIWTEPEIAPFSGKYLDFEPYITPDGKKFYFTRVNLANKEFNNGIWVMDKLNNGWSEPEYFRSGMFITTSHNSTIYYTDISDPSRDLVSAEFKDGRYDSAAVIDGIDSEFVDGHPCVAPDESFIIYNSKRPDRNSPWDLYVAFRNDDGSWGTSYNLGRRLGQGYKMTASLSPGGKYLFYYSNGDIYWVDAKIIQDVIPKEE